MNDSVGALHIALAAAVVGWLVFVISHSFAVWKKRSASDDPRSSRALLYIGLLLCVAALAGGWLDRELTRRAGVILGTDFFVVRAHARTTPHLIQGDSVDNGAQLATFEDPEAERQEAQLQGEIQVLEQQIASTQLRPLILDPELLRLSQDVSDSQRARLTQLGYGVLRPTPADPISTQALNEDGLIAAQRSQSHAAETQFERTSALVQAGVVSRDKLEAAEAAAQTAAQDLHERENLIRETKAGSQAVAHSQTAILRDSDRAKAERTAELAELNARLSELRISLLQFHMERSVTAPFSGTIVYRHPSPALVEDGKVILALAKGPGFLATVQLPAREASMLVPGQQLRMKLKHSLVSEEVSGQLRSIQQVPGYPDRRNLLIECVLPPEQFAEFSSGTIPVTLQWRPPLYTDRVTEGGLALSVLPMMMWPFRRMRRKTTQSAATSVDKLNQISSAGPSNSVEEKALHELALILEEAFKHQTPSSPVLKRVELPVPEAVLADPMKEEMDRVLAQLGLTSEDLLPAGK